MNILLIFAVVFNVGCLGLIIFLGVSNYMRHGKHGTTVVFIMLSILSMLTILWSVGNLVTLWRAS